jgi:hypothetical protein
MNRFLKRDALNRVWRTILQTLAATVLIPAGDAAMQVAQRALLGAAGGHPFDWRQVATSAAWSAGVGATIAVLAWLHRIKLDPSSIPSAAPPPIPVVNAKTDLQ